MAMGVYNKTVTDIMRLAGKTSTTVNKAIAESSLLGVISDLNLKFKSGFLSEQGTVTFAGGSSNHTVAMPFDFASMKGNGFGEWDSANSRIKLPWTMKTESYFHRSYRGILSLQVSGSSMARVWFFVEDKSNGQKQVRAFPSPSSSMTAGIYYYAKLTKANIDRLPLSQVLVHGAVKELSLWFGTQKDFVARASASYKEDIRTMKAARRSSSSGVTDQPNWRIQHANSVARGLY